MLIRARTAVWRAWRRWRRLGGVFTEPESSDRARRLTARWSELWPDSEPAGHLFKWQYPERWIRFHTLPEGKRYADTPAEYEVILGRHLTALGELVAPDEVSELLLIAEEWGRYGYAGGWTQNTTVEWWPWRTYTDPEEDEDGLPPNTTYFWVGGVATMDELASLLRGAADDQAEFIVAPQTLDWIYVPYDGGADVLHTDLSRRDAFESAHADWRESCVDGF